MISLNDVSLGNLNLVGLNDATLAAIESMATIVAGGSCGTEGGNGGNNPSNKKNIKLTLMDVDVTPPSLENGGDDNLHYDTLVFLVDKNDIAKINDGTIGKLTDNNGVEFNWDDLEFEDFTIEFIDKSKSEVILFDGNYCVIESKEKKTYEVVFAKKSNHDELIKVNFTEDEFAKFVDTYATSIPLNFRTELQDLYIEMQNSSSTGISCRIESEDYDVKSTPLDIILLKDTGIPFMGALPKSEFDAFKPNNTFICNGQVIGFIDSGSGHVAPCIKYSEQSVREIDFTYHFGGISDFNENDALPYSD